MSLKKLHLCLLIGIFGLTLIASGCGQNPTSSSTPPSIPPGGISTGATVSGTILCPTGTDPVASLNRPFLFRLADLVISRVEALSGQTALPGAIIKVYNFLNGTLVAQTTTDINGWYSVDDIPQGIDVVVVAEKTATPEGTIRLTAIVPNVDVQTTITGSVDVVTSLAAEQLCLYYGQSLRVNMSDLNTLLASAEYAVGTTDEVNMVAGGGYIGASLGSGLTTNEVTSWVINATPSQIQMNAALAKAIVQDIRDCANTLTKFYTNEVTKQMDTYNNIIVPHVQSIEAALAGSMEALLQGKIISTLPYTVEAFVSNEVIPYFTNTHEVLYTSTIGYVTDTIEVYFDDLGDHIRDVNEVCKYVNHPSYPSGEWQTGLVSIEGDFRVVPMILVQPVPGLWKFTNIPGGKTVTITVEGISTNEGAYEDVYIKYRFSTKSSVDTTLDYHGWAEGSAAIDTMEAVPFRGHVVGYLKDSVIGDAITFEADVNHTGSGTPPNYKYSTITLTGIFVSRELKVNGTVNLTAFQDDLYPEPSQIVVTGTIDTVPIDLSGALTVNTVRRVVGATPEAAAASFSFNGSLLSDQVKLTGLISGNIFQNKYYPLPYHITATDFALTTGLIKLSGTLNYDLVAETINTELLWYPSNFSFSGRMDTKVLTFEGNIDASVAKQVVNPNLVTYSPIISLSGKFIPDVLGFSGNLSVIMNSEIINSKIYGYPTSLTLYGLITTEVFKLDGKITVNEFVRDISPIGYMVVAPKRATIQGKLSTDLFTFNGTGQIDVTQTLTYFPYAGGGNWNYKLTAIDALSLQGSITTEMLSVNAANLEGSFAFQELPRGTVFYPTHIAMTEGVITAPNFRFTGNFSGNAVDNPSYGLRPHDITFSGIYSDRGSPEAYFDGTWTYSCANAATANYDDPSPSNFPRETFGFNGTLKEPGYPIAQAILNADATTYLQKLCSVFYSHGLNELSGTYNIYEGLPTSVEVDLTNQLGAVVDLNITFTDRYLATMSAVSGTVKSAGGVELAHFELEPTFHMVKIHYSDGTFETLF